MLRTPGRVASCQPAAVLSVSCLVAVYLSFTHSTHSFGQPISRTFLAFSYLSLSPSLSLSVSLFFFFLISLFFVTDVQTRWPRYNAAAAAAALYASACENIFSARAEPNPTDDIQPRCPAKNSSQMLGDALVSTGIVFATPPDR